MRIVVLNAHPDEGNLCCALSGAYVAGARQAGHEVGVSNVRDLTFDPIHREDAGAMAHPGRGARQARDLAA
jgi:putative NADPH-quinone reductase